MVMQYVGCTALPLVEGVNCCEHSWLATAPMVAISVGFYPTTCTHTHES